jgi:hypothetical protein
MSREKAITIILRAKNAMAAGLSKAGKALKSFGSSALRIGKFFAKAFLGAGAAVAGFAAKAISAYAVQEAAERSLVSAMNAHGEAGDALLPMMKRIASAIQDETGAADEATLAGMAKMRMLGVQVSQMEKAAKGVIALKSVGLEESAAQKAVAMAMQGNYDMLNRYVPALRSATSETEKAQIVNELFEKGYAQQAGTLDTVAGQWGLLKGRVGDLWEEIGLAIVQNESLMEVLKRAGEAVKAFGVRVSEWIEGGGVTKLIAGVQQFYEEAKRYFLLAGNSAMMVWAPLQDGAETAISYTSNVIKALVDQVKARFGYLGKLASALWDKITHPTKPFQAPSLSEIDAADKKLIDAVKGKEAVTTAMTEKALADRAKIEEDYAKRTQEIRDQELNNLEAMRERQAKAAKDAAEAEKKAAEESATATTELTNAQKKGAQDALKEKLKAIQEEKSAAEELANKKIQDLIEERRAGKEDTRDREKEDRKAKTLAAKLKRGTRLSKKDQEWLSAFGAVRGAKADLGKEGRLTKAEQLIQQQIDAAQESAERLKGIDDTLHNIESQNDRLLTYGG